MTTTSPTNVLFILADDLGWGDVSCYHPEGRIPTPHIDSLAREGMRFTDAHAASSVCTPSRYALLTGEYCWRTWLQAGVLRAYDPPLISASTPTLPGIFRDAGYRTACVGKWHLGFDWPHRREPDFSGSFDDVDIDYTQAIRGGPLDRGFDEFFGMDTPVIAPHTYIEGRHTIGIPDGELPEGMFGAPGDCVADWELEPIMPRLTDRMVSIIESSAGSPTPFFGYFAMTAPHTPISPSVPWQGRSGLGPYGDFVMQLDHHVGELIAALERTGQRENTLVIFTSDNGSADLAAHRPQQGQENSLKVREGHDGSGPFRGWKGDLWEGGHRIPLIASLPGVIPAGATDDHLVSLIDMIPTLAALVDITVPQESAPDAVDVSPYFTGDTVSEDLRPWLIHHGLHGHFGIRKDEWKLILTRGSSGFSPDPHPDRLAANMDRHRHRLRVPPAQLYDLLADLAEEHNRYGEKRHLAGELEVLLAAVRSGLPEPRFNEERCRWETIV